jgi:hypothetical protein
LAALNFVLTEQGEAFKTMELGFPLALPSLYPFQSLGDCDEGVGKFAAQDKPVRQKGKTQGASTALSDRRREPLAQHDDAFRGGALRDQRRAAHEARLAHEPEALLGRQSFDRVEMLQRKFRLAAVEVEHRAKDQR